jgi:hypothetical protein
MYIHIIVVRSARIDSHIAAEPALGVICIASAVRIVNTIIRDGAEESGSESVNGSQTKKRYELHKKQQLHILDMRAICSARNETISTEKHNQHCAYYAKKF